MSITASPDRVSTQNHDWLMLAGARVVVAGVGGIGAVCIEAYRAAGCSVFAVDRDPDRIDAVCQTAGQGDVFGTSADLTAPGEGTRVIAEAVERLGGLDVLLHCVGVNDRRPVLDFTEDEWDRVMRVNLSSAFGIAQAAGRVMVGQGHGRIVMLSSVSGLLAHRNHGPYAASKGGMNQMMRVMAAEWAGSGVTVNALAPGYIETHLTAEHLAKPGVREGLVSLVPAGRLGTPAEVTGPALFLSSPQSGFVTGHVMYVDGGRTLV